MAKGFFNSIKESAKEGWNDTETKSPEEVNANKELNKQKKIKVQNDLILKEVDLVIGKNEQILYHFTFWNDKMIVTDKKLIYIDKRIAKHKTFAMIPFNQITSYSLLLPTGISVKGKLKIFTGGDNPAIEIETVLNEGMNEFCKILADIV